MIAHVSIPARDPKATAALLARLMGGTVIPFEPAPGAFAVVVLDGQGTMVEVLPKATTIEPGVGETAGPADAYPAPWAAQFVQDGRGRDATAFHVAIATRLSTEEVVAIGREAGLRTINCNRGGRFDVVEMWIDGSFMIEWLVPAEAARYRALFTPEAMRAMMDEIAAMTGGQAERAEPALAD